LEHLPFVNLCHAQTGSMVNFISDMKQILDKI
jgi:hypothetical protein